MPRETVIENHLVKEVRKLGGICYKFTSPGRIGVPDRICVFHKGLVIFAECKQPGKIPSPHQQREIDRLRKLGYSVYVIDSHTKTRELIDEAREILLTSDF